MVMKYRFEIWIWLCAAFAMAGCSEDALQGADTSSLLPIELGAQYPVVSRASASGFEDADRIGIYVAEYANGTPVSLTRQDIIAANVAFTFDEANDQWEGARTLYWPNSSTSADIIGYYPYQDSMEDATRYGFSIKARQDKESNGMNGYEASDLLWAKSEKATAGSGKVMLTFKHLMAGVTIRLNKGEGFDNNEWAEAEKRVYMAGCATGASVNLEHGTVTLSEGSNTADVVPVEYKGEYRAVIVPQTYKSGKKVVGIDVDGKSYSLALDKEATFVSGKMHTIDIKVDKKTATGDFAFSASGFAITPWQDDSEFHEGIVRQYITVHVENPGMFISTLEQMGLDSDRIQNLKVTGRVNSDDLMAMGDLPALNNLNMKEMVIDNTGDEYDDIIPEEAFSETPLMHITFPDKLKKIGRMAFFNTSLVGTVIFPEGLEYIGEWAFAQTNALLSPANFNAVFPSTLKSIDEWAFGGNGTPSSIRGELALPEGLEEIGEHAFHNGSNIKGSLVLPESLERLGELAFSGCNFSGSLDIPSGIKSIPDMCFSLTNFDGQLILHEGLEEIRAGAFEGCKFKGELVLPSILRSIGYGAFRGNEFSSIALPEKLQLIGSNAFAECTYLMSEITFPEKIAVVPEGCFADCPLITSITLGKNIVAVKDKAFANMQYLNKLVCENPEPPELASTAFENFQRTNLMVEVPKNGLDAYRKADVWREFPRIAEYRNFVCRPAATCALNSAHRETLVLNADAAWEVEHQPSWVKLSATSGNGNTSIAMDVTAMGQGSANRNDSIVFKLKDADIRTYCHVSQYDYEYAEDEVVCLQQHTKGNGIDIYFVGDGWTGEDLSNGSYLNICKEQMEHFFGLPPYDRLRGYFNVYAMMALSQERGINTVNLFPNTKFQTLYTTIGMKLIANEEDIFNYVSSLTGHKRGEWFQEGTMWKSLVILVPNSTEYPGNTYYYADGATIAICPPSNRPYPNDTRGIVQHEAGGHGFGKLGDESILLNKYAPDAVLVDIINYQYRGYYANLSVRGSLYEVGWGELIFHPQYSNYVDVFEGGYGYTRRVFRSEANSCMKSAIPYYNAISRLDITHRVYDLAGEAFDIERDFYSVDTNEWGETGTAGTRNRMEPPESFEPIYGHTSPTFVKRGEYKHLFNRNK